MLTFKPYKASSIWIRHPGLLHSTQIIFFISVLAKDATVDKMSRTWAGILSGSFDPPLSVKSYPCIIAPFLELRIVLFWCLAIWLEQNFCSDPRLTTHKIP